MFLYCHPNTAKVIRRLPNYLDAKIVESEYVPEFTYSWNPPEASTYVEYTEDDELWMRNLGIGVSKDRIVYQLQGPDSLWYRFTSP